MITSARNYIDQVVKTDPNAVFPLSTIAQIRDKEVPLTEEFS